MSKGFAGEIKKGDAVVCTPRVTDLMTGRTGRDFGRYLYVRPGAPNEGGGVLVVSERWPSRISSRRRLECRNCSEE